jgi:hypothetical protein
MGLEPASRCQLKEAIALHHDSGGRNATPAFDQIGLNARRRSHRDHLRARDHPGLAHPLVARIEDQIGKRLGKGTPGKLR